MGTEHEALVARLGARQWGLVAWRQLREAGLPRATEVRRLESGEWVRVHRGVVKIAPGPLTVDQRDLAALLAAGPNAVLSHQSAARRHGLDVPRDERVHLAVAYPRNVSGLRGVAAHRSRDLAPPDTTIKGPFRLTTVVRTLVDLAAELDDAWMRAAVDSAIRQSPANLNRLLLALQEPRHGRAGLARLRQLAAQAAKEGEIPDSALESLAMELGLATGRKPTLHHRVGGCELDLAWPELSLGVELDSWRWHSSREAFARDRRRDRALLLHGWAVLRFIWREVDEDRTSFVRQLQTAHATRLSGLAVPASIARP